MLRQDRTLPERARHWPSVVSVGGGVYREENASVLARDVPAIGIEVTVSVLREIRSDIQAALDRDPAARGPLEVILFYPGFHARLAHRLAHALHRRGVPLLPRGIMHLVRFVTGIEIHPGATIGPRFFIDHGMGVVIGETTEVGADVWLYQGVTLGGTSTQRKKRHPTLRDGVTVGAGAKLIGAIVVGENARIGAGSVVVTNVPANATVVGVPGHIVAFRDDSNGTVQRLPDPEWERINELDSRLDGLREAIAQLEEHLNRVQNDHHHIEDSEPVRSRG